MERLYLKQIKAIHDTVTAKVILNVENLRAFTPRSRTRHACPLVST